MEIDVGQVEALFRYPVKSMRGESLATAMLGWSGIEGDRRLALRRLGQRGDFPWLTASKLPELVMFTPRGDVVRTPDGDDLPVFGEALAAEIERRHGSPVEMMQMKHGIFDEAAISVITSDTIREIGRLAGRDTDIRRFRPNILVRSTGALPFEEDAWVGGTLVFGDAADAPVVSMTMRDLRCVMVNIDPDRADADPEVMKAIARANANHAGAYATVTRCGRLEVGQRIVLHR
jgi:hypothetical protein